MKKMKRIAASVLAGIMILFIAVPGFAEETGISVEHGKLNTADASPVDPGKFEMEFGYSYSRAEGTWARDGKNQGRGLFEEHAPGLTLVAGIYKNLDLTLGINYLWLHDEDHDGPTRGNGLGDLGFSARYRFVKLEDQKLEAAFITGLTALTGTQSNADRLGTSQEFWSWENALVLTKDWGPWTTNAELAFSLPFGDKRGSFKGALTANLALGYQILPWLQPELELNYLRDFVSEGEARQVLALTAGLIMPVHERLRVNLGLQQGLWGRIAEKATVVQLAIKTAF